MQISAVPAGENQREHVFGCGKTFCREKVLLVPVVGTACVRSSDLLTWHFRKAWFLPEFSTLVKDMAFSCSQCYHYILQEHNESVK